VGYGVLDANVPSHLPGPRAAAKYVVHRNRVDISLETTTSDTVFVFGDFVKSSSKHGGENRISPMIGVYGSGTDVPGATETFVEDPYLIRSVKDFYSLSLHNLTVEARCTGTSAGLIPPGLMYIGALPIGMDRADYGNWEALAEVFKTKQGMSRFTAYEALQHSRRALSYPLDPVRYSEFRNNDVLSEHTDTHGGALAPIVLILDSNATTQTSWTITVHLEWRMRANVDPMVQSMQRSYKPVSEDTWHQITTGLSNVGGVLNNGVQIAQTVGSLVQGFRGIAELPALRMRPALPPP